MDLFALWHSSQRTDPGLNIAMYANVKADKLLAKARETSDPEERLETYLKVEKLIAQDYPAIFLYSPNFIYLTPKHVQGISLELISKPSERFGLIHKWFIETDSVWHFFIK
jgi:peptide/nickel transport system substrate-binding protein